MCSYQGKDGGIVKPLSLADITLGTKDALPSWLRDKRHNDWPWPLSYVPRWVTAYPGLRPKWPDGVIQRPIPLPGMQTYHLQSIDGLWRPYFGLTTIEGLHIRAGFRWDDIDGYYNLIIPWMATMKVMVAMVRAKRAKKRTTVSI